MLRFVTSAFLWNVKDYVNCYIVKNSLSVCFLSSFEYWIFDESSISYQHNSSGDGVNSDILAVAEARGPFTDMTWL